MVLDVGKIIKLKKTCYTWAYLQKVTFPKNPRSWLAAQCTAVAGYIVNVIAGQIASYVDVSAVGYVIVFSAHTPSAETRCSDRDSCAVQILLLNLYFYCIINFCQLFSCFIAIGKVMCFWGNLSITQMINFWNLYFWTLNLYIFAFWQVMLINKCLLARVPDIVMLLELHRSAALVAN